MVLCLLVAGFVGSLQAHQTSQRRRMAAFQSQCGISRIVPLLFPFVVVIIAQQRKRAKHATDIEADPSLVLLARLGLISSVDLVGGPLQQKSPLCISRFEDRRTHQHLQLLDGHPVWLSSFKARHQLRDFLVLGEEDLGREVFFLKPPMRSARVCSMMAWAYSSTRL